MSLLVSREELGRDVAAEPVRDVDVISLPALRVPAKAGHLQPAPAPAVAPVKRRRQGKKSREESKFSSEESMDDLFDQEIPTTPKKMKPKNLLDLFED